MWDFFGQCCLAFIAMWCVIALLARVIDISKAYKTEKYLLNKVERLTTVCEKLVERQEALENLVTKQEKEQ